MSLMCLEPKRRPPMLTHKQLGILRTLVKGNADGSLCDVNQLIERVAPGTTRGAMICSLRHLAMHDLVCEDALVKRRGRRVRTYAATDHGKRIIKPSGLPSASSSNVVTP